LRSWTATKKPFSCGEIVAVNLVFAGFNINRNKLAVVVWRETRLNVAPIDELSALDEFILTVPRFQCRHPRTPAQSPGAISTIISYQFSAEIVRVADSCYLKDVDTALVAVAYCSRSALTIFSRTARIAGNNPPSTPMTTAMIRPCASTRGPNRKA
jgi:hypothetical protein